MLSDRKSAWFARFAWGVLIYNILVIVWGALVRASGSGDGCGANWPTCQGEVLPSLASAKTLIEYTHRMMTGLDGPLILALCYFAFRVFPKGHRVRFSALLSVAFLVSEALIGALLVKKGLVAQNTSVARAVWLSGHLVNTFLLLAWLTLTALWSSGVERLKLRGQGAIAWALGFALFGAILLGISGAVTALGDTLFPVHTTAEVLRQTLTPGAHFLQRLRIVHPLIAMSVGLYLLLIAGLVGHLRPSSAVQNAARGVVALFIAQMLIGLLNKTLLAPIWLQLIHLLAADLLWLNIVALAASALAANVPQVELAGPETFEAPAFVGGATWRDYLALTKPRVISLLLFTTLAAMFIAADKTHHVTLWLFTAVFIGGYAAAGAANVFNMVIDRDIDGKMKRTSERPTVTQKITSRQALIFGFALEILSFGLLWGAANLLTAALALAGLVFYILVYTLGLKRRTTQNIVIGGAAGCFPPLVGWAAVTGTLSPLAYCLFAIIFVWTPVHFWALALLLKEDYASVGIPMLPVVRGERVTVIQIGLYTIVTVIVSLLPFVQRQTSVLYLVAALALNAVLALRSLRLYLAPDRPRASSLFHYSMLYLALLFLFMAVDRTLHL